MVSFIGSTNNRPYETSVKLFCERWDCPRCGQRKTKGWIDKINNDLPGSVLYIVWTPLDGKALSAMIRRDIKRGVKSYSIHLYEEAVVVSNTKFKDALPKNRWKCIQEIEELMKSGKVKNVSRRPKIKKNNPRRRPWSFAIVKPEIMEEFNKCKNDYEIGLFLLKHRGTKDVLRIFKRGQELLRKMGTGEINQNNCNLRDLV
jgi:hypothetical protein